MNRRHLGTRPQRRVVDFLMTSLSLERYAIQNPTYEWRILDVGPGGLPFLIHYFSQAGTKADWDKKTKLKQLFFKQIDSLIRPFTQNFVVFEPYEIARYLLPRYNKEITIIERDKDILASLTNQRLNDALAPNTRLIHADAQRADLTTLLDRREQFDVIVCSRVLPYAHNPSHLVKNLDSVLKPGGYFIGDIPRDIGIQNNGFKYPTLDGYDQLSDFRHRKKGQFGIKLRRTFAPPRI